MVSERHRRRLPAGLVTAGAGLLVWAALAMPGESVNSAPVDILRLPLEGILLVLAAVLLPRWAALAVATVGGVLLGVLVLLKALDLGFTRTLSRLFDVANDWTYLVSGVDFLAGLAGAGWAWAAVAVAVCAAAGLLVLLPLAARRVTRAVHARRGTAAALATVLAVAWVALAGSRIGWQHGSYTASAASLSTTRLAWRTAASIPADLADRADFARLITQDRFAATPAEQLLSGLAGKDVLVVFVESYGEVALDDPRLAPTVRGALAASERELSAAGFTARSAWLDSPTFGGASWLAHATLQSGLWVDSQARYNQLLSTGRLTLTRAFADAGWRTAFVVPAVDRPWPQGRPFYGFDTLYDATNLGYHGTRYGYATMPDQYTLHAFAQRELTPGPRAPVMAEIDLLSSHYRWVAPPPLLPPGEVGDGAAFTGPDPAGDRMPLPQRYAASIAYSLRALAAFVAASGDPNLVVLALGDHQPNSSVTPAGAGRRVPVMLLTADPAVAARVAGWEWSPGLAPGPGAPTWRMDAVRDRFLDAFR